MSDTFISFSTLVGKTIESVREDCVNVKTLTFTDGTSIDIEAEANAFSGLSIPHIFLCRSENDEEKRKLLQTALPKDKT